MTLMKERSTLPNSGTSRSVLSYMKTRVSSISAEFRRRQIFLRKEIGFTIFVQLGFCVMLEIGLYQNEPIASQTVASNGPRDTKSNLT